MFHFSYSFGVKFSSLRTLNHCVSHKYLCIYLHFNKGYDNKFFCSNLDCTASRINTMENSHAARKINVYYFKSSKFLTDSLEFSCCSFGVNSQVFALFNQFHIIILASQQHILMFQQWTTTLVHIVVIQSARPQESNDEDFACSRNNQRILF